MTTAMGVVALMLVAYFAIEPVERLLGV